jgi:hypothetical protein
MLSGNHCCHPLVVQGECNRQCHSEYQIRLSLSPTLYIFILGQASNWLVNQLQADAHPTICITFPRMICFLIATTYPLLSKFISLLIVGNTTLVQTEEKSLAS